MNDDEEEAADDLNSAFINAVWVALDAGISIKEITIALGNAIAYVKGNRTED